MAVPALTNNSPSAGYIAWAAFNINYLGVAYAIPAGNSNATYVWWPYNSGAGGTLQASNTQPTLTNDDMLLFINKGGIAINVQNAAFLDGDLIVNGTVTASAIIAGAIGTTQLAAGSVTTSILAAGAVVAASIAAGAIDGMTITGALLRTAASGKRWEINASFYDTIKAFSGSAGTNANETTPAFIQVIGTTLGNSAATLGLSSPAINSKLPAQIILSSQTGDGSVASAISLLATTTAVGGSLLDAASHPYPRWNKDITQVGFDGRRTASANTNASGQITLAHNLGVVPIVIVAKVTNASASNVCDLRHMAGSDTTTQCTFQVVDFAGASVGNGVSVQFEYLAIG